MENVDNKYIKYLLYKIYEYIEKEAYGHSLSLQNLMSDSFHVEHCFPKSSHASFISRFGNFLLLDKANNCSLKDKKFELKQQRYLESHFLLNKILSKDFFENKENSHDKIIRTIKNFNIDSAPENWNIQAINSRNELYIKILKKVLV